MMRSRKTDPESEFNRGGFTLWATNTRRMSSQHVLNSAQKSYESPLKAFFYYLASLGLILDPPLEFNTGTSANNKD